MPSLFGHCSSSLAPESVTVSEEAFQLKAGLSFIQVGIMGKLAILQVRVSLHPVLHLEFQLQERERDLGEPAGASKLGFKFAIL